MFLKLINIDHFGTWENSILDEFELRTTVIYGRNEAGKSTLMEFIRGVFFGWSSTERTKYLDSRMEVPQGGEITLVDQNDNQWRISRTALFDSENQWRDNVKITRNDVNVEESATWEQLLKNVSEAVFENVFTIGLNELEELAALDRTEAAEFLYDLSAGAERVALSHAAIEIANKADGIVADTPSWDSIDYCLKEQDKQRAVVEHGRTEVDDWCRLSNRLRGLIDEIELKSVERKSLQDQAHETERAIEAIPLLEQRNSLFATIQDLSIPGDWDRRDAEDAINVLRDMEVELSEINSELVKRRENRERLCNEQATLQMSTKVIAVRPRIQSLEEQSSWIASLQGQIATHQEELERLREELDASGASDHGDWISSGRSNLVALRQPARQLKDAKSQLDSTRVSNASLSKNNQSAKHHFDAVKSAIGVSDLDVAIAETGDRISSIRKRINVEGRIAELSRRTESLEDRHDYWLQRQLPTLTQLAVLGTIFITGAVSLLTLLFLSSYLSLSGSSRVICLMIGVAGTIGSVFGKYAVQIRSRQQMESHARKLDITATQREQLTSLQESLEQEIGQSTDDYKSILIAAEQRAKALAELIPLKTESDASCRELAASNAAVAALEEHHDDAIIAWQNALSELGIPEELTPSQVKHCVASGEEIKKKQHRVNWLQRELDDRSRDLQNIVHRIQAICAELDVQQESADLLNCIRLLSGVVAAEERKEHQSRELQLAIDQELHEIGMLENESADTERKRNRVLIEYGACDVKSLTASVAQWSEYEETQKEITDLDQQLRKLISGESSVHNTPQHLSIEQLDSDLEKLVTEMDAVDGDIATLNQKLGAVRQQLNDKVSDRSHDNAALELSRIGVCVDSNAQDWRVLAATDTLFHMLRNEYETSRQPEVLQEASEFMRIFTDGKYVRIWTPVEEPVLYLDDENGEIWTLDVLSRGTREAAFLCIRFALVKHYASRGLQLPLILDDVLVNCDDQRMRGALSVIDQMHDCVSQVFFFTCHQHIRDAFGESEADVRSITPRIDLKAPALQRHWAEGSQSPVNSNEVADTEVVIIDSDDSDETVLIDDYESESDAA